MDLMRLPKRLIGVPLGKVLFYQERVDEDGNVTRPRLLHNLNQKIIESGKTPPWVFSSDECLNFWKNITNEEEFGGNRPSYYAAKSQEIIKFLIRFWTPEVRQTDSILELGSNCGANLNGLYQAGFRNLLGVEINGHAIKEMKRVFPEVSATAKVSHGSLEELLPKMDSKSVDAIFTMAVLIHIHPESQAIFSHMVRIARKHIVVVEAEVANNQYVFARNYRRIFEKLGCRELRATLITREAFPEVSRDYDGYTARCFEFSS